MVMHINKSHTLRVYPNQEQRRLFARPEGACRYVYNRALAESGTSYQQKKAGEIEKAKSVIDISRDVTQWKKQEDTAWLLEVPSSPLTQALRALDDAFKRFFKGQNRSPKKHRRQKACSIRSQLDLRQKTAADAWANQKIFFPGFGILKTSQPKRLRVAWPKMLTLSRDACGRYFVAFMVEVEQALHPANDQTVGVDLGVKILVVYSTGEKIKAHKAAIKLRRKLKHAQKTLCPKQGAMKDTQHKLTDDLTQRFGVICLEDLNVKGIMASAKGTEEAPGKHLAQKARLNRGIAHAGFGEIRRQIEYKAHWRGCRVLFCDPWAPTSRTGSCCDAYQATFSLKIRAWTCSNCGAVHDRDRNAAINILTFASWGTPEARAGNIRSKARREVYPPGPDEAIQPTRWDLDEPRTESQLLNGQEVMPSETRCRSAA